MNERIFKLALQAMDFHGAIDTDTELKLTNDELEKFAELIVKECLSYTEEGDLDFMKFMIKKHFGVEE